MSANILPEGPSPRNENHSFNAPSEPCDRRILCALAFLDQRLGAASADVHELATVTGLSVREVTLRLPWILETYCTSAGAGTYHVSAREHLHELAFRHQQSQRGRASGQARRERARARVSPLARRARASVRTRLRERRQKREKEIHELSSEEVGQRIEAMLKAGMDISPLEYVESDEPAPVREPVPEPVPERSSSPPNTPHKEERASKTTVPRGLSKPGRFRWFRNIDSASLRTFDGALKAYAWAIKDGLVSASLASWRSFLATICRSFRVARRNVAALFAQAVRLKWFSRAEAQDEDAAKRMLASWGEAAQGFDGLEPEDARAAPPEPAAPLPEPIRVEFRTVEERPAGERLAEIRRALGGQERWQTRERPPGTSDRASRPIAAPPPMSASEQQRRVEVIRAALRQT